MRPTVTSDDAAAGLDEAGGRPDDEALAQVMRDVPRGALALSGLTVGLLLLAWLLIYAFVFLPRGMVS